MKPTPPPIAGRYEVLKVLGQGASGMVVRCRDRELDRPVAAKLLHRRLVRSLVVEQRFAREAKHTAGLRHPHVVQVLDFGQDPQQGLYIVYELLEGRDLQAVAGDEEPGPERVLRWGDEIAGALAYLHEQGVLHRDVKPANVMIREDGAAVLCDLGLAYSGEETARLTDTDALVGTLGFLSREVLVSGTFSEASDQFAWAASLYELLYREGFRTGEHIESIVHRIIQEGRHELEDRPLGRFPRLDEVLFRALEPAPEDRYPDMGAFRRAWEEAGRPSQKAEIVAAPPPPPPAKVPWGRLAFLGLGCGLVLGLLSQYSPRQASPAPTRKPVVDRSDLDPYAHPDFLDARARLAAAFGRKKDSIFLRHPLERAGRREARRCAADLLDTRYAFAWRRYLRALERAARRLDTPAHRQAFMRHGYGTFHQLFEYLEALRVAHQQTVVGRFLQDRGELEFRLEDVTRQRRDLEEDLRNFFERMSRRSRDPEGLLPLVGQALTPGLGGGRRPPLEELHARMLSGLPESELGWVLTLRAAFADRRYQGRVSCRRRAELGTELAELARRTRSPSALRLHLAAVFELGLALDFCRDEEPGPEVVDALRASMARVREGLDREPQEIFRTLDQLEVRVKTGPGVGLQEGDAAMDRLLPEISDLADAAKAARRR